MTNDGHVCMDLEILHTILYSNNVAYLGIAFFYCYVFQCSVLSTVAFFKCYIFLSAFFEVRFSKYRFVRTLYSSVDESHGYSNRK